MKTLTIKDLVLNEELGHNAMTDVRGGIAPVGSPAPVIIASRNIVTTINQILDVLNGSW